MSATQIITRKRCAFPLHQTPRCFESDRQWEDWLSVRVGAASPCEDCTPDYHQRMHVMTKCGHPEVIFAYDSRSGEVFGINSQDPRYARILLGLKIAPGITVIGQTVTYSESWLRLLKRVRRRAHREVKWAIDIWQRRYRAHQQATAKHTDLIETHHA